MGAARPRAAADKVGTQVSVYWASTTGQFEAAHKCSLDPTNKHASMFLPAEICRS